MMPVIHIAGMNGVMLAVSSSPAGSIIAKVTATTALGLTGTGWRAGAVRRCVMRCWLRRSA